MLIKASRITNLTDARYFAAREVQFLGFNLEAGTEGFLDPIYMKAIREWVEGPTIVGEFSTSPAATVAEAAAFFGLDAVEVGENYIPELSLLNGLTVLLRLENAENPETVLETLRSTSGKFAFAILHVPSAAALEEHIAEWKAVFEEFPVILQADAEVEHLMQIIDQLQPAGLSVRGGEEEKTGVKSFDDIEAIFDALEDRVKP